MLRAPARADGGSHDRRAQTGHGRPRTPRARVTPIRDWTKTERPRERLLEIGAGSLSDAELFALFLHSGVPGWTAVDLARELLQHFGTLRSVLDASATQLCALRGIGPARAAQLLAVSELCRRALAEKARDRALLDSPGAVEDYLKLLIGTRPYEVFVVPVSRCAASIAAGRGIGARLDHARRGLSA